MREGVNDMEEEEELRERKRGEGSKGR